ncbi:Os11g0243925, partial [Oryza sativa Japonica Group]
FYEFPNAKNGSQTSAQIWLQNDQNSEVDLIISGWETDGTKSTGCSNLDCTGFVQVNGAPITPGNTLDHNTGQTKNTLKIFYSLDDGDWWLHFGNDIGSLSAVGYWPNSLFKSLDHVTVVAWGGYT